MSKYKFEDTPSQNSLPRWIGPGNLIFRHLIISNTPFAYYLLLRAPTRLLIATHAQQFCSLWDFSQHKVWLGWGVTMALYASFLALAVGPPQYSRPDSAQTTIKWIYQCSGKSDFFMTHILVENLNFWWRTVEGENLNF